MAGRTKKAVTEDKNINIEFSDIYKQLNKKMEKINGH